MAHVNCETRALTRYTSDVHDVKKNRAFIDEVQKLHRERKKQDLTATTTRFLGAERKMKLTMAFDGDGM